MRTRLSAVALLASALAAIRAFEEFELFMQL
jgi:hypothetical protein